MHIRADDTGEERNKTNRKARSGGLTNSTQGWDAKRELEGGRVEGRKTKTI